MLMAIAAFDEIAGIITPVFAVQGDTLPLLARKCGPETTGKVGTKTMKSTELMGLTTSHLGSWEDTRFQPAKTWPLHRDCIASWDAMVKAAATDHLRIIMISGFRDFERQRIIWNEKFLGLRAVTDEQGKSLKRSDFTSEQWCEKILRFSALPGLSRHHWGTDMDVFDGHSLQHGHRPQLLAEEFCAGGPCADLHDWLNLHASKFGFFRPYATDLGGVAPEPWHLSFGPVSRHAVQDIDADQLATTLQECSLESTENILPRLTQIIDRYARNISPEFTGQ